MTAPVSSRGSFSNNNKTISSHAHRTSSLFTASALPSVFVNLVCISTNSSHDVDWSSGRLINTDRLAFFRLKSTRL